MLALTRTLLSTGTIRLAAASFLFNALLIGGALWVTRANVSPLFIVPLFLIISLAEMVISKMLPQSRRGDDMSPTRSEAMRRVEIRRKPGIVDETTGLYVRWYFDRRIEEEAARCRRYQHSMAVVVLKVGVVDLTTFSLDGWQKRSLEAARCAAKVVREVDLSAAISPFEFAICLVHCDRDGAHRAINRMLIQMPDYNCEAGVAVFPDEGYEASAMVEVASARMRRIELPTSA